MNFRRTIYVAAFALAAISLSSFAIAQVGPPHGTIYAHDVAYQTVGTPTELPNQGKFDTIYVLGGDLANVSDAAPGDMEFNGGRWEVRPIMWTGMSPTQFTNAEQIHQAAMAGQITIGDVVKRFVCPLIRK
jgi:hypothetical protein